MANPTTSNAPKILEENVSFADYLDRYDGQRVEWHAGTVVEKMSNNTRHNVILLFVAQLFSFYVDFKSTGKVLLAGIPMFINKDQPAREPDLMVVLNENASRITSQYVDGAADLVVEIISPATGHVDRGEKFTEYEESGVREYWIIDPQRQEVLLYVLNDAGLYQRQERGENGKFASALLSGFAIDPEILWREQLPQGMEIVQLVQEMM